MKRIRENSNKMAVFAHIRARKPIYLIYKILPYFPKKKPGAYASRHSFDLVIPEGLEPATR